MNPIRAPQRQAGAAEAAPPQVDPADHEEPDNRDGVRTAGGQHLQTPSKADQRIADEEAHRQVNVDDYWQMRAICSELHVVEAEVRSAVAAVGTHWPAVRAHLQRAAATTAEGVRGDDAAAAGPGQPGQHGERGILQEHQTDQFRKILTPKESGADKQDKH